MTDPKDPLKDGLTPPDYDEYGDVPESGENERITGGTCFIGCRGPFAKQRTGQFDRPSLKRRAQAR